MQRDYDDELLEVARIKQGADERIHRRISASIHAITLGYVLLGAVVTLTIFLVTMRHDLNEQAAQAKKDRGFINQLYIKNYGVEITFGSGN